MGKLIDMEGYNLHGLSLDAMDLRTVSEKMNEVCQETVYRYPWNSLENDLKVRGLSRLPLMAYGSLVNFKSAAITLKDNSLKQNRPVIAFGVRRLFNYIMPEHVGRYGPVTGNNYGALNVQTTGDINDVVNGIMFEIALDEISAMKDREIGYDLVPVATINWNGNNIRPFLTYILSCPNDLQNGRHLTSNQLVPHKNYYLTCREGAHNVGKEFLQFWLTTTFLADGITPVSQWEVDKLPEISEEGN